ncbi:MAG: family N-acetyltransferase [Rhodospirillales bacterium]|jgi:GNAT superfamily N-acetyltransferase|nr:family N-acetyltransferase [Rhodospirillales bacterium]
MTDTIRPTSQADLELICEHRERMFAASGRDRAALKPMTEAFRDWLRPRLIDKSYFGWIIERDGRAIAGVGMMLVDRPPHPFHPMQDRRGYVLNMYVEPDHRRQGLAKRLMDMVHAEAGRLGLDYVTLHATRQGRPLYQGLDWLPSGEMGFHLAPPLSVDESKMGKNQGLDPDERPFG